MSAAFDLRMRRGAGARGRAIMLDACRRRTERRGNWALIGLKAKLAGCVPVASDVNVRLCHALHRKQRED